MAPSFGGVGSGSVGNNIGMSSENRYTPSEQVAWQTASENDARRLQTQMQYPTAAEPSYHDGGSGLPSWYSQNNNTNLPVAYSTPSALKEHLALKSALRKGAGSETGPSNVLRTDPLDDQELSYLKSMKDQSDLARFDEYVAKFVNPHRPGEMKWLMEVYPDFVQRRLSQAHSEYEYAMRNQMIDSWGINTFDDLHFKYMVDQGMIKGPKLSVTNAPPEETRYTPAYLSPFKAFTKRMDRNMLSAPFSSANFGERPRQGTSDNWEQRRIGPMAFTRADGDGSQEETLAKAMYNMPTGLNNYNLGARPA